jgi:hypothetical protein
MTYEEIRPKLQTFDIVLFRGRGLASLIIRWVCSIFRLRFTKYSHIGLVVLDSERVLLFEAVPSGVHLVALSDAIAKYDGDVYIRQLVGKRTMKMLHDLYGFIQRTIGKPYEKHLIELMGAATPLHIGSADNTDFFCSELVTRIYQMAGLVSGIPLAKEYEPDDYRLGGSIDKELAMFSDLYDLERAYCLGPEIPIEKIKISVSSVSSVFTIPLAKEYEPDDYRLGGSIDKELAMFSDLYDLERAYCLGPEIPY